MSRGQYIMRRLVQLVPVVIGITVVVFFMLRLIPGDPAEAVLGEKATDAQVKAMHEKMGLNKPIPVQYFYYVRDLVQGDLGTSTHYAVPVNELIWRRLWVSLQVVIFTAILATVISLPLGILAALKKDSILDNVVRSTLMITLVMPTFYTGIMIIILLAVKLNLFPVSGYGETVPQHIKHLFLPSLTLALGISPILIRSLRTSILEAMRTDYVKTARAKGLDERSVITVHVLRNALIPTVTLLGLSIGGLVSGTVITERVFSLPGAGALLIDSISARDYATVQSATLIFAVLVVFVNLATDVLYSFIDPRVRFS